MSKTSHHCGRFLPPPMSRREMLKRCSAGFGSAALMALMADKAFAGASTPLANNAIRGPLAPRAPHHTAKAKSVIFLYMDGGPSQVDTFDYKPRLERENGQPFGMRMEPTAFNNNGNTMASPWKFRRYGECGLTVSDLFPHVGQCADDLCVIRSMTSEFPEHSSANFFLHTGHGISGRPSMGAWVSYGLGTENQNLPGFVVLNGGLIPPGGLDNFSNGFLSASHQGSIFKPAEQPVANIHSRESLPEMQRNKLDLLRQFDSGSLDRMGHVDSLEAAIANYELAFRMQSAVPELMDLAGETELTKKLYGMDASYEPTRIFATQCLMARRMVERGVRFIELTCPRVDADRWDQHGNLETGHARNALAVDQPIAGLLRDLKMRGLLDETLVVWAGEFGRTPFAQGAHGRDHNQFGFTVWMAGGGVKGGITYGETDEYGYKVVDKRAEMFDLHATILHLLGINHEQLTVRFSGRDMRLTDVHGYVMHDIIA